MTIPAEFSDRVYKTKVTFSNNNLKKVYALTQQWQNSELDVIYENLRPVIVIVFETEEDCLAFTLKYGKEYV